jgi:hypothetical protein
VLLESTRHGLQLRAQIALLASILLQLNPALAWTVQWGAPVLLELQHVVHVYNVFAF